MPFRLFLLSFLVLGIGSKTKYGILLPLFFFANIFASLSFFLFYDGVSLFDSAAMMMRIAMVPVIYVYLKYLFRYKSNIYIEKFYKTIFYVNFAVFIGNMILGILGFGFQSYVRLSYGIKGFFYDGNMLTVLLICFFAFFLLNTKKKHTYLFFVFFFLGLLIGSKIAIFGTIILYLLFIYSRIRRQYKLFLYIFICVLIFIIVFVINNISNYTTYFDSYIKHMEYLSSNYDIITTLLSTRNLRIPIFLSNFSENFSIFKILFGLGYLNGIIEIDPFDTLFSYGIIFFIMISLFYFFVALKVFKKHCFLFLFNILYFCISMTSGHVWYNAMAGFFFVLLNLYFTSSYENEKKNILYHQYVSWQTR
jgi:hypothetical protein